VDFAKDGTIARIYDRTRARDVLEEGTAGNELLLFEDRPGEYDAWNIDFNYEEVCTPISQGGSIKIVETGPIRATVRVTRKTTSSTIVQDISLWKTIRRIDFATTVEWHEKHKLLKAAFPVGVLSRTATYEIQYGAIERPTHYSTSHDRARFEVPGHRWIDLSEANYGVSLLNDCKYGFNVHGSVMRITLLRSPTGPDPHADEGHHEFVYSLYPHSGSWQEGETVRRAYELNVPLVADPTVSRKGSLPPVHGIVSVDRPNAVVDCVKKAEDSDALIVRLYEAHGGRGHVRVVFARPPRSASECDLMEENDLPVEIDGPRMDFYIKPWEIRTFKVHM
jgi:alpha-mannosidase